jgi:uncharacterized integral membrane protein
VSVITGIPSDQLKPYQLYQLCDEFVAHHGKTGEREVYIYREGFHHESIVAFVVLALTLVVRAVRPNAALNLGETTYPLSVWMLVFLIVTAVIGSWLTFKRYFRFGDYRVTQAVLRFLAIRGDRTQASKSTQ